MKPPRVNRVMFALLGASCVAGLLATTPASAGSDPSAGGATLRHPGARMVAPPIPRDVSYAMVRHSILGTHTWYRQNVGRIPVYAGWYAVHAFKTGRVVVADVRAHLGNFTMSAPTIGKAEAAQTATRINRAKRALDDQQVRFTRLYVLPDAHGSDARLAWLVTTVGSAGQLDSFIDASNGKLLKRVVRTEHKTAGGKVFSPNPSVALQRQNLKDSADSNAAVPQTAYRFVTLHNLDPGTNKLHGAWAKIINTNAAVSRNGQFSYNRHDDRFEQVNAYYAVNAAQAYFRSIGIKDANAEPQRIRTDAFAADNSFYEPAVDLIEFGSGGVDDAEDQEIVWHEYGHAVQDDQVPNWGQTEQGGAMGEGWGDYLAFTMSQADSPDTSTTPLPCIGDWDAISYTSGPIHCLRRVDGRKMYPNDLDGEVHDDGEIWSRALYDVNRAIGRTAANRTILEAQFQMTPKEKFVGAANTIVSTAQALYGAAAAAKVRQAFVNRGILN